MNPLAWIRGLLVARNESTEALHVTMAETGRLTQEMREQSARERHQLDAARKAARLALARLRREGDAAKHNQASGTP